MTNDEAESPRSIHRITTGSYQRYMVFYRFTQPERYQSIQPVSVFCWRNCLSIRSFPIQPKYQDYFGHWMMDHL